MSKYKKKEVTEMINFANNMTDNKILTMTIFAVTSERLMNC